MALSLTSTKLIIPPPQQALVPRLRLFDKLNQGLSKKLTLISAPAGYGKTMLLSAWANEYQIPLAWITLEEGENDLVRFLAYLVGALDKFKPGISGSFTDLLLSPQLPPGSDFVSDLINEINLIQKTFVLVLDDYHLISEQAVHDTVIHLLTQLPQHMHLYIAARADPPLKLSRLRANSELNELRLDDLIFTRNEVEQLFNGLMTLDLDQEQITALTNRTEGWIAGLQMAAISLRSAESKADFVRSFSGSNRFILDYLVEEVLRNQSEEVQSFLMKTSILDRLTASLCDEVTGQDNSWEILENLERTNLFIIPLDEDRAWYRYHQLFRDLLSKRAQQYYPQVVPEWHRLASLWFERHDFIDFSIEHALAARDNERAAWLIGKVAQPTLIRGEFYTFKDWVKQLPEETLHQRSDLILYFAWALVITDSPVEMVEAWLDAVDIDEESIASKVGLLRSYLFFMHGEVFQAIQLIQKSLPNLSPEDSLFHNIATWLLSLFSVVTGDFTAGTKALETFVQKSIQQKNIVFAAGALCSLAEIHLRLGQLHQAQDDFEQALSVTRGFHGRVPIAARALMGLGELRREWNDLELASQFCLEGIALSKHLREVSAIAGYITLANIEWAKGDWQESYAAIHKAQELALQSGEVQLDDAFVELYHAKLDILHGDLEAAGKWVELHGLEAALDPALLDQKENYYHYHILKYELLVLARWFIAMDQPQRALDCLEILREKMEAQGRIHLLIETLLLSSIAFQKMGRHTDAAKRFNRCLTLASPGGYVRMFLDEGTVIHSLLTAATRSGDNIEYAKKLLAAFISGPGMHDGSKTAAHTPITFHAGLPEPLTGREVELLSLIADGLSNQEIARHLFISLPTVKWHTSNIYGKLGVRNRTQAVIRARSLGIIAPG